MKVGLDTAKFNRQLADWVEKFEIQNDTQVRFLAFTIYTKIRYKTPVETGTLRANWHLARFSPRVQVVSKNARVASIASVRPDKRMRPIYITNAMPYAAVVEYGLFPQSSTTGKTIGGYSKQAPRGMVRLSIQEVLAGSWDAKPVTNTERNNG